MTAFRCALAVITLRNRPDKEAFALLQQPVWLSSKWGVLDCIAPTDEAGHSKEETTQEWELQWPEGVVRQACDRTFAGSNLG